MTGNGIGLQYLGWLVPGTIRAGSEFSGAMSPPEITFEGDKV